MAFCTPIWKMFFKSGRDANKNRTRAKVSSEDEDTTRSECVPQPPSNTVTTQKPNEDNRPRVLTKEEKLKQKRREEIEKLRETLRNRKQLLFGTVEIPVRRGTIEGYNIRISNGKDRYDGGKRRHTFEEPYNRKNLQPTSRKSMEEFAKFIEAKIQQIEERKKINNRGDELKKNAGCVSDDPVKDALVDRLIELQPDKRKIAKRKGSLTKEESKNDIHRKPRRMSDPSKTDDHPKRERPLDLTIKSSDKQKKPDKGKETRGQPVGEKISKTRGSLTHDESKDDISKKSSRMSFSAVDDHSERGEFVDRTINSPEKRNNHQENKNELGKPDPGKIAKRKGSLTRQKSTVDVSKKSRRMSDPSKIDDHSKRERPIDLTNKLSEPKHEEHKEGKHEKEIANRKETLTSDESEGENSKNSRHMSDPSYTSDGHSYRGRSSDLTSPSPDKQTEPESDEEEEETPTDRKISGRKRT